ncbi:hypothetical protein PO909_020327 [Leuciscus waleckii]
MIFAAVVTVHCRILWSAALQFPFQTVMQLVSTLVQAGRHSKNTRVGWWRRDLMVSVEVKTGDGESSAVNIQHDEHHENTEQDTIWNWNRNRNKNWNRKSRRRQHTEDTKTNDLTGKGECDEFI